MEGSHREEPFLPDLYSSERVGGGVTQIMTESLERTTTNRGAECNYNNNVNKQGAKSNNI